MTFDNTPTPESVLAGVPNFPDTMFGPQTRDYVDRVAMDRTRLRGTLAHYYVKEAQVQRIDGEAPGTDAEDLTIFDRKAHAGFALYGEPVVLSQRIDSVRRGVTPTWTYRAPFEIRGIVAEPSESAEADERGGIFIDSFRFDIARKLADDLGVEPRRGDVILLPKLLDSFYDVEEVLRDESRFGGTGFFVVYKLQLVRNSKFTPPRKQLPTAASEEE